MNSTTNNQEPNQLISNFINLTKPLAEKSSDTQNKIDDILSKIKKIGDKDSDECYTLLYMYDRYKNNLDNSYIQPHSFDTKQGVLMNIGAENPTLGIAGKGLFGNKLNFVLGSLLTISGAITNNTDIKAVNHFNDFYSMSQTTNSNELSSYYEKLSILHYLYLSSLINLSPDAFTTYYRQFSKNFTYHAYDWFLTQKDTLTQLAKDLTLVGIQLEDFSLVMNFYYAMYWKFSLEPFKPQFKIDNEDLKAVIVNIYVHNSEEDIRDVNEAMDELFIEFANGQDKVEYLSQFYIRLKPYYLRKNNFIYLGVEEDD